RVGLAGPIWLRVRGNARAIGRSGVRSLRRGLRRRGPSSGPPTAGQPTQSRPKEHDRMGETPTPNGAGTPVPKIAGLSALKGLVVYAAILSFAGLYGYFIVKISTSADQPNLSPVLVSAAAALAGVLGSAFALAVNVTTPSNATNARLNRKLPDEGEPVPPHLHLQRLLTLDPVNVSSPSWPKTLGIWLYATVGGAVAVTYA